MFKKTDSQESLFTTTNQLPQSARRRLKGSWAETFATEVMPILLEVEDKFAGIYSSKTGRPAWSVARKLGLLLLQHMFDLDDQSALDELQFDIRWQYALGVAPEEAYLSRRSFVQFRTDLVEFDPEMSLVKEVFERVTSEAMGQLEVDDSLQRVDSTLIVSNVQLKGRRWLFAETLLKFLRQLQDHSAGLLEQVPEPMRQWFERRESDDGWFGGPGSSESPTLEQMAPWLVWVVGQFGDDEAISSWQSYELVARVVDEHCQLDPADEGGDGSGQPTAAADKVDCQGQDTGDVPEEVQLREGPKNSGASMQTPHDPDVAYGHKGAGYSVHVAETCYNQDKPELITGWMVLGGNDNDWSKTQLMYDRLEAAGWTPTVMYADGGYPTPLSIIDARHRGSRLHSPVSLGSLPPDYVGRDRFEQDDDGRVVRCPVGEQPVKHTVRKYHAYDEPILHAVFAGCCEGCQLQGKCPARHSHGDKWYVGLDERLQVRDEALSAQQDDLWWDDYSIRSGIEATMAELKGTHGMAKLRVRGRKRVELAVGLKMCACNIKRWAKNRSSSLYFVFICFNRAFYGRQPTRRPDWGASAQTQAPEPKSITGVPWLAIPVSPKWIN